MLLATLRMLIPAFVIFAQVGGPGSVTRDNTINFNAPVKKTVATMVRQDAVAAVDAQTRPRLLQHGFTEAQIAKIHELALADVRGRTSGTGANGGTGDVEKDEDHTSAHGRIDPGEYKASVEDFGGIKINTDPQGAEVRIDNRKWSDPTDCSALTHSGTRTVRLKKDGYKPVIRKVNVPAGDWASMDVTLDKQQP